MKRMKKKNKDLPSFKETWSLTIRACKIWNKYSPNYILSIFLFSIFSAISPYVSIYFSAQILNALSGDRDPERLKTLILLTLGITAAMTLLTSVLKHWKQICGSAVWHRNLRITADKLLSMDFAAADAAETERILDVLMGDNLAERKEYVSRFAAQYASQADI